MANQVIWSSERYLSLIHDRLHQLIYDNSVIHADETPVKVLRIDNNKIKNGKKTYMWVYRNNPRLSDHSIILYDQQPSRKADHPRNFLKDFSGTVITDGYQVYHKLEKECENLSIGGCWIHARRFYSNIIKSIKNVSGGTIAEEAYRRITEMLHIDNGFDDLPSENRLRQRQLFLTEKVDDYFVWTKLKYSQVTKNSAIGKTLAYSIHQEQYLRLFLTNGDVPMENNLAEQAIRPFTIGRKNFVMINSSNGAQSSAIIYSLVETAKSNNLNVYQYFELLLTEIPKHMGDNNLDFIDALLPWSPMVQEKCPNRFKKS